MTLDPKKIILVMAGDHKIYQQWLRATGLTPAQCRYLSDAHSFMGYRNVQVVRLFGWWTKDWASRAMLYFDTHEATIIDA